jgi:hypothetical protein
MTYSQVLSKDFTVRLKTEKEATDLVEFGKTLVSDTEPDMIITVKPIRHSKVGSRKPHAVKAHQREIIKKGLTGSVRLSALPPPHDRSHLS